MKFRGRGYIPDPDDHKVTSFRRAKLGAAALPASVDLRPFAPPVLDQNDCGSCVGHAIALAVATSFARAGNPLGFVPSPRGIYCLARTVDRVSPDEQLVDEGSMPNQAVRSIAEWGVRPMRTPSPLGYNSDCDLNNVNDEPTLAELEQDATALVLGQYEIDSFGAQRITDLCAALAGGFAVTCSVSSDNDTWRDWTPARGPLGAQSPVVLDHYVWFIGYRTENGKRIFRIRNQWGLFWGDAGEIEVTEAFVAQVGDLYAFNVRKVSA